MQQQPWGVVPLDGRGDLVFCSLHGEPLHVPAVRAVLAAADVVVRVAEADRDRVGSQLARADLRPTVSSEPEWWADLRAAEPRPLLVHDPLCPLTPRDFLIAVREAGHRNPEVAQVGFRPVTDTVKSVDDGMISGTIDRSGLAAITSPVLVPTSVMAAACADDAPPPLGDTATLVSWLRERCPLELIGGPGIGRRVDDESAVLLLECVDEVGRRVRA